MCKADQVTDRYSTVRSLSCIVIGHLIVKCVEVELDDDQLLQKKRGSIYTIVFLDVGGSSDW